MFLPPDGTSCVPQLITPRQEGERWPLLNFLTLAALESRAWLKSQPVGGTEMGQDGHWLPRATSLASLLLSSRGGYILCRKITLSDALGFGVCVFSPLFLLFQQGWVKGGGAWSRVR